MSVIPFPLSVPPPFGSDADQPLRVLRPDLSERVARVNDVRALLRRLDLPVLRQDLVGEDRPVLHIERRHDGLRGRATRLRVVGSFVSALIDEVEVRWPHSADEPWAAEPRPVDPTPFRVPSFLRSQA